MLSYTDSHACMNSIYQDETASKEQINWGALFTV